MSKQDYKVLTHVAIRSLVLLFVWYSLWNYPPEIGETFSTAWFWFCGFLCIFTFLSYVVLIDEVEKMSRDFLIATAGYSIILSILASFFLCGISFDAGNLDRTDYYDLKVYFSDGSIEEFNGTTFEYQITYDQADYVKIGGKRYYTGSIKTIDEHLVNTVYREHWMGTWYTYKKDSGETYERIK